MADQPDLAATPTHADDHFRLSEPVGLDLRGRTLGDYRIERLLGRGGMGEVYLAHQISLNRPVAFKVLRADLLTNPVSLSRFEAEAAAAARINHPNIVHIYQMGNIQGIRYIAMEYVEGTNLREYIVRKGGLTLAPALSIMKQAALAVGASGEAGLVHRDIKPDNILLTRKGQVKVADFGLSRHLKADSVNLTQQGVALGTPMYMSPEQVQGKPVDHRSDLYSLGVTFFYLLAGTPPFQADNAIAIALKHVHEKPADLGAIRPDLPRDLIGLVQKLMAKPPIDRYQLASDVVRELSRIRSATVDGPSVPVPVSVSMELPPVDRSPSRESTPVASRPSTKVRIEPTAALEGSAAVETEAPRRSWTPRLVALLLIGLAIGGLSGWTKRPTSLLASGSPGPDGPSMLWIDPSWARVPRQPSAEGQYRYAQLQAPLGLREPAWLAVPGHYPADREWGFRALVQLGRDYYRRHDEPRLASLARALESVDNPREAQLAHVVRAGVAALRDDDEVLANFSLVNPNAMDPAVIELAVEIVSQRRKARPDSPSARRLAKVQNDLMQALQVEYADLPMPARALKPRP